MNVLYSSLVGTWNFVLYLRKRWILLLALFKLDSFANLLLNYVSFPVILSEIKDLYYDGSVLILFLSFLFWFSDWLNLWYLILCLSSLGALLFYIVAFGLSSRVYSLIENWKFEGLLGLLFLYKWKSGFTDSTDFDIF